MSQYTGAGKDFNSMYDEGSDDDDGEAHHNNFNSNSIITKTSTSNDGHSTNNSNRSHGESTPYIGTGKDYDSLFDDDNDNDDDDDDDDDNNNNNNNDNDDENLYDDDHDNQSLDNNEGEGDEYNNAYHHGEGDDNQMTPMGSQSGEYTPMGSSTGQSQSDYDEQNPSLMLDDEIDDGGIINSFPLPQPTHKKANDHRELRTTHQRDEKNTITTTTTTTTTATKTTTIPSATTITNSTIATTSPLTTLSNGQKTTATSTSLSATISKPITNTTATDQPKSHKKKSHHQHQQQTDHDSGGAYGSTRRGHKSRNGPRPEVPYNLNDLSQPIPDEYECGCFIGNKFLAVCIFGRKLLRDLNETEMQILRANQSMPQNQIPRPYPPETLHCDYELHPWVYYVHFNRWDRRLEQWVTRDRLRVWQELVRHMQPYSLQCDPVGMQSSSSPGLLVSHEVIKVLQPRYPHLRGYSLVEQRSASQRLHAEPTQLLPNNVPVHPYVSYARHLKENNNGEMPLTPPPTNPNESYLIPFIIPSPLPIIPILPPNIYSVKKIMEAFEQQYIQTAFNTLSIVLNTPLQKPPSSQMGKPIDGDDIDTTVLDIQRTTTTTSPRNTRGTKKQRFLDETLGNCINAPPTTARTLTPSPTPLAPDSTLIPTPGTIILDQDSKPLDQNPNNQSAFGHNILLAQSVPMVLHHDQWYGPSPEVELPETALLHYGPDCEEQEHITKNKFKSVSRLVLGRYDLSPWYYTPLPDDLCISGSLWCCEYCLSPFAYQEELTRHRHRCEIRHPPGIEIYRSTETNVQISMFEVDGANETIFCENLCFLAKLFLDHKFLEYDCSIFLFYVLCEVTEAGMMTVGFFSKEKAWQTNNLACILTFPQFQGRGYGKFLISMSYELGKVEKRLGGPERPLSDLGRVSYIAYWTECSIKVINHLILAYQIKNGMIQPPAVNTNLSILHSTIAPGVAGLPSSFIPNTPTDDTILPTHHTPILRGVGPVHGIYYTDLASTCNAIMQCPDHLLDKVEVSIKDIARLTCIFDNDIEDALKERKVLVYSMKHNTWCLSWSRIREILMKAKASKAAKDLALQKKDPSKSTPQYSIRYAIPHFIRWLPYSRPLSTPTPVPTSLLAPPTTSTRRTSVNSSARKYREDEEYYQPQTNAATTSMLHTSSSTIATTTTMLQSNRRPTISPGVPSNARTRSTTPLQSSAIYHQASIQPTESYTGTRRSTRSTHNGSHSGGGY